MSYTVFLYIGYIFLYMVIYFGLSLIPSNSHHHDYHVFEIGDPNLNLHVLLFLGRGTSQDIFGRHGMMMASIGCSHGQEKSSGIWQLKPAERPTAGKLTRDRGEKPGGICGWQVFEIGQKNCHTSTGF